MKMTKADIIARTTTPATTDTLTRDLRTLGLSEGVTVLVHSSLSSLGWTAGGAEAVIGALTASVGVSGTVMVPTHSGHLTDPSTWENPAVPETWWPTVRESMPPYNEISTVTTGMGIIPETFRHLPDVRRSSHPTVSFAARGPHRDFLLDGHSLDDGLGESSPLARLCDLHGFVLLLGVGHENNTSLHLAQYRAAGFDARREEVASPMMIDGVRQRVTFTELVMDADDFVELGAAFERDTKVTNMSSVGMATARLMPVVDLVDYATRWLKEQPRRAQ
jgi:aminoglycoside 3-N-acetyltransferase